MCNRFIPHTSAFRVQGHSIEFTLDLPFPLMAVSHLYIHIEVYRFHTCRKETYIRQKKNPNMSKFSDLQLGNIAAAQIKIMNINHSKVCLGDRR